MWQVLLLTYRDSEILHVAARSFTDLPVRCKANRVTNRSVAFRGKPNDRN